jgi:hypothetical protein
MTDDVARNDLRVELKRNSKFFQKLEAEPSDDAKRLACAVVALANDAKAISDHVILHFPQYTLHQECHL